MRSRRLIEKRLVVLSSCMAKGGFISNHVIILIFTDVFILPALRRLQVPAAKVHADLLLCPLLSRRGAAEVCRRPQDLWRLQRLQATQRAPPPPAPRSRQLSRL